MAENLKRFYKPQEKYYQMALREIKAGQKRTHWIWFIFPQLKGLGFSDYSKFYGINGLEEAKAYMQDEILKSRLIEISAALESQRKSNLADIVGDIDSSKIHACWTLFYIASKENVFKKCLKKYFNGQFHQNTMKLLKIQAYNMNDE